VTLLFYASGNWTINRSDQGKVEPTELRFLLSVTAYTLLDRIRNADMFSPAERAEGKRNSSLLEAIIIFDYLYAT
jgi:hypothetical protein